MIQCDDCIFFRWVGEKPPPRTHLSFMTHMFHHEMFFCSLGQHDDAHLPLLFLADQELQMAGKHVTQFVHDMCLGVVFFVEKKGVGAE